MTDPLCARSFGGPGYNLIDATRADRAGYPVAALLADSASRGCGAEWRLPSDPDLLGQVNPLLAVIRTGAGAFRLVLNFFGS